VTPEMGVEWVRMGRNPPISTTPTGDVMISYWNTFQRISAVDLPESGLNNKILIWGLTAEGLNNPVSTPMGVMYPHEVQANLIQTVLQDTRIQQSYYLEQLEIVLLLSSLLMILLMVYKLSTVLAGIMSLTLVALQLGGGYYLWTSQLVLFDTFWSSISSLIVFGHASFNQYYTTYQLKEQIKKQFQKYLSPEMVEELQKDPSKLKLGGERKEMTFMFMDICGFTPISEAYKNKDDPEGLVELINKFLDVQTKIIINNRGTIDKYMGDCIMAFWNAPLDCEDHADLAVKSALEVLEATKKLNEELSPLNLPPINVGIGISTGECIVGNMGSEIRFDYSVIGDAVNLGARLEGQTRNYDGVDLLLSERTYQCCPSRAFTEVDRILVKGKSEKVRIFTPLGTE
jgi:adenylate cyclase